MILGAATPVMKNGGYGRNYPIPVSLPCRNNGIDVIKILLNQHAAECSAARIGDCIADALRIGMAEYGFGDKSSAIFSQAGCPSHVSPQ